MFVVRNVQGQLLYLNSYVQENCYGDLDFTVFYFDTEPTNCLFVVESANIWDDMCYLYKNRNSAPSHQNYGYGSSQLPELESEFFLRYTLHEVNF